MPTKLVTVALVAGMLATGLSLLAIRWLVFFVTL